MTADRQERQRALSLCSLAGGRLCHPERGACQSRAGEKPHRPRPGSVPSPGAAQNIVLSINHMVKLFVVENPLQQVRIKSHFLSRPGILSAFREA